MDSREKKKGGRPEKYSTHVEPYLDLIEAWRARGVTEAQVAANLGVGARNLVDYKHKYPQLAQALKRGLDESIAVVESSLLKRCQGFEWTDVTTYVQKNGTEVTTETRRLIPPDTTACIFYLKNRAPKDWRDKQEIDHTLQGKLDVTTIEERQKTGFLKFLGGK